MHICVCVCGRKYVNNAIMCWLFNVPVSLILFLFVSETVFLLCLLFHTDNILCGRGSVHSKTQGRLCPQTSIASVQLTTVGPRWIQNPLRCSHDLPKSYQTEPEPRLFLTDLPAVDTESLLPDDAGDAGFSWQQREHGVVSVRLLQAVLSALPRRPLSVQQCKRDVAVGVLVSQRRQRWQGSSRGYVILVAAVVVFLPHGGVVGVVEGGAQLGVGGGHGGGGGCGH